MCMLEEAAMASSTSGDVDLGTASPFDVIASYDILYLLIILLKIFIRLRCSFAWIGLYDGDDFENCSSFYFQKNDEG